MSVDEILSRRRAEGFDILLEPTPGGLWRCRVREGTGGPFTFLRPAHQGFPTPLEAATDTDQRLSGLIEARTQASAAESLATLERLLAEGKLDRRDTTTPGGLSHVEWVVRDEQGSEVARAGSVRGAVEKARDAGVGRAPQP